MPGTPEQLAAIALASLHAGIPAQYLYGVWGAETNFSRDPGTSSPNSAGAVGPFQITPDSLAHHKLTTGDPNNFPDAAQAAAQELAADYKAFHRWDYALAAYNAGIGGVQRAGGIPQNGQTNIYVPRALGFSKDFPAVFKKAGLWGADPSKLSQLAHEPPSNLPEQVQNTAENIAQGAGDVASEIGKIATLLFTPATWLTVLEVIAGTVALFFGLRALTGQSA